MVCASSCVRSSTQAIPKAFGYNFEVEDRSPRIRRIKKNKKKKKNQHKTKKKKKKLMVVLGYHNDDKRRTMDGRRRILYAIGQEWKRTRKKVIVAQLYVEPQRTLCLIKAAKLDLSIRVDVRRLAQANARGVWSKIVGPNSRRPLARREGIALSRKCQSRNESFTLRPSHNCRLRRATVNSFVAFNGRCNWRKPSKMSWRTFLQSWFNSDRISWASCGIEAIHHSTHGKSDHNSMRMTLI